MSKYSKEFWDGGVIGRRNHSETPEVARPLGKDGGPQTPKDDPFRPVATAPPCTWDKDEMAGQSEEGHEEVSN